MSFFGEVKENWKIIGEIKGRGMWFFETQSKYVLTEYVYTIKIFKAINYVFKLKCTSVT